MFLWKCMFGFRLMRFKKFRCNRFDHYVSWWCENADKTICWIAFHLECSFSCSFVLPKSRCKPNHSNSSSFYSILIKCSHYFFPPLPFFILLIIYLMYVHIKLVEKKHRTEHNATHDNRIFHSLFFSAHVSNCREIKHIFYFQMNVHWGSETMVGAAIRHETIRKLSRCVRASWLCNKIKLIWMQICRNYHKISFRSNKFQFGFAWRIYK